MGARGWSLVSLGVLFVTVSAPTLYNVALFRLPLGVVLTLTAVAPLYAIPMVYVAKGERTSLRAKLGALLACLGFLPLWSVVGDS